MTMSDKHRDELASLLTERRAKAGRWNRYGVSLLQMGLRPEADAWAVWQTVTGIACTNAGVDKKGDLEPPGDLARLAAMFGAALAGDDELYEEHAVEARKSYAKTLASALVNI